jgi:hypothetical protein
MTILVVWQYAGYGIRMLMVWRPQECWCLGYVPLIVPPFDPPSVVR